MSLHLSVLVGIVMSLHHTGRLAGSNNSQTKVSPLDVAGANTVPLIRLLVPRLQ